MSRQNLNSIFQRKALDVSLLQKLSLILDYNFFEFVTPEKFKHSDDSARQPNTEEPERIPDYSASRKPRITVQIAIDDPSVEKKVLQLVLDEEQIKKLGLHSGD